MIQQDRNNTQVTPEALSDAGLRSLNGPTTAAESLVLAEELLTVACERIRTAERLSDVKAIADDVGTALELVSRARVEQAPDPERTLRMAERWREMKAEQAARRGDA